MQNRSVATAHPIDHLRQTVLDCGESVASLSELNSNVLELATHHTQLVLRGAVRIRRCNECAAPVLHHDHAPLFQETECVPSGVDRDPVLASEFSVRGQLRTGLVVALLDPIPETLGQVSAAELLLVVFHASTLPAVLTHLLTCQTLMSYCLATQEQYYYSKEQLALDTQDDLTNAMEPTDEELAAIESALDEWDELRVQRFWSALVADELGPDEPDFDDVEEVPSRDTPSGVVLRLVNTSTESLSTSSDGDVVGRAA